MWVCRRCDEEVEDQYGTCWKCGAPRNLPQPAPIKCLRCEFPLVFMGKKDFHEGPRVGVLGDFAEFFVNKEPFHVYVCMKCGHVEMFVANIGAENRPRYET